MAEQEEKRKEKEEEEGAQEKKGLKRQACEVFSRVVGYIRPVHQWNKGKQSEFNDRKYLEDVVEEEDKKKDSDDKKET